MLFSKDVELFHYPCRSPAAQPNAIGFLGRESLSRLQALPVSPHF